MPAYNPTQIGPRAILLNPGSKTFIAGTRDATQTPPTITFEPIANGLLIPVTPAYNPGRSVNTFVAQVLYGSAPTGVTITPVASLTNDNAASFQPIANATALTQTGGLTQFSINAPFVSFLVSGLSGTGTFALVVTL